ncbi:MAG: histidine phosphatase family protein [Chloroflexi bacterium]|nr:histidine phosphatase family protein [Chloroflexota bacterium]MBI3741879.1 histidine phosphatase family protein [Chloroflexota bacterium]
MHLIFIRHGETDWNVEQRIQGQTDTPLNARGMEQAEKLAAHLAAEEKISALYSSPQQRARVTAETIARQIGIAPMFDDRLKEKFLGELEGMQISIVEQKYPEWFRAWRESENYIALPGEEEPRDLQIRVQSFLDELKSRHANGARVAIVTHGATLNMLMATLLGWDIQRRLPFWFDNASVNWVDCTRARPRIRLLNDTCHLRNGTSH